MSGGGAGGHQKGKAQLEFNLNTAKKGFKNIPVNISAKKGGMGRICSPGWVW